MNYIKDKETAYAMWENLVATFEPKSRAKRVLLRKKLNSMKCSSSESLENFFLNFDKLVSEYRSAGGDLDDEDLVETLLASLPDNYDNVVTVLETMEGDCTYDKAKTALLERELKLVEKHANANTETSTSVAFSSKKGKFNNRNRNRNKKKDIRCYTCGEAGHKSPSCPKKGTSTSNEHSYAFMTNGNEKVISFYVDSGATEHWITDESLLNEVEKLDNPFHVQVAKEETSLEVTHGGKLHLLSEVTNEREKVPMNVTLDVFVAKGLRHNLLSVQRIEAKGGIVTFANGKVTINVQGKTVAEGHRRGKLYVVDFTQKVDDALVVENNRNELWHRRYGHMGMSNVCKLVNKELVIGVKEKLCNNIPFCDVCVKGKQTRLPFNKTRPSTRRPLERVHSDVCGPMDKIAIDGSRYFVTFTDDFTHLTVTYLMKNKSETFNKFREYHEMATAHFNTKLSILRSDRGGEYLSDVMKSFCKEKGVVLETNAAYNPESNGLAERINRTLVEKARSMLIDAHLPRNLWGEAVIASTYLTNRSPTVVLKDKTPFEMWFSRKPDISNLRVFGSRAFAHIPDVQRKKFDNRSKEFVMIGYDHSGYRLYDPESQKVVIRRNVVFDESVHGSTTINHDPHLENETGEHLNTSINIKSPLSRAGSTHSTPRSASSHKSESPHPGSNRTPEVNQEDLEEEIETPPSGPFPLTVRRRNPTRECRTLVPRSLLDYELNLALSAVSWVKEEPLCYKDVLGREDENLWMKAIDKELNSLDENKTWEVVPKPNGIKPLGTRWVFKIKDEPNDVHTYKARLVVRGFQQREGVDYYETYAPVARMPTIRFLLALTVQKNLITRHLDVTTAFLYGNLSEEVYLLTPDGIDIPDDKIIRLKKSLYGLKQSPRCWNDRFHSFIVSLGFVQSKSDYCLYVLSQEKEVVYLVIYVDDTLMAGSRIDLMNSIIEKLSQEFKMKDLGPVKRFMGLNIDIKPNLIEIDQSHYIRKILHKFSMKECNPLKTPMEVNLKLVPKDGEPTEQPFRELIGTLMYLAMGSRPDLSFAVNFFSRLQEGATDNHWSHLKRVLRYMQSTIDLKLTYKFDSEAPPVSAYVDADWGSDTVDRKSTSGYVLLVYNCPILWQSKKQPMVALSSTEAEFVAACSVATEILWVHKLFSDINLQIENPTTIFEDNQGTIAMSKNPETRRTKHIDIRYNFLRDLVQEKKLKMEYVSTSNQIADILTKALPRDQFETLRNRILSGSVKK